MKCVSTRNRNASVCGTGFSGALALACLSGFLGVISVLPLGAESPQQSPPPTQAQIRAAFIFNFPKFAEWPMQTYTDSGTPLTVCFFGADDVRTAFQGIAAGKAVNGRLVEVRAVKLAVDVHGCQVVYMDSPTNGVVLDVLKYAREGNGLAIGTSENFLVIGGMIRLQVENNRMRFDVNVGAVGRTKIKLSSKLLALARSVVDLPEPGATK